MSKGRKLPLILTIVAILALAFAVGCRGFFQNPTLSTILVQPPNPTVQVGTSVGLQAYGVDSQNNKTLLSSGVVWTSSDTSIATVSGTGSATLTGVTPGAVTVTASSQGVSATANATVIGNVTSISVSPTTGSIKAGGTGEAFTFTGSPGPPQFITSDNGGTLTISPSDTNFTCTVGVDSQNNPAEVCSALAVGVGSYTIQMSYPNPSGGTVLSPTVTVTVSP